MPAAFSQRGFAAIGLVAPQFEVNIGGVVRAAGCYGASLIAIQGAKYRRNGLDTMKFARHMPIITCDSLHSVIPFDAVPVAVELIDGAKLLTTYDHPQRAFYIFGPENGSLGKNTLSWCRDVVAIPTQFCMNLAATVNVVLYDRLAKISRQERPR